MTTPLGVVIIITLQKKAVLLFKDDFFNKQSLCKENCLKGESEETV